MFEQKIIIFLISDTYREINLSLAPKEIYMH